MVIAEERYKCKMEVEQMMTSDLNRKTENGVKTLLNKLRDNEARILKKTMNKKKQQIKSSKIK